MPLKKIIYIVSLLLVVSSGNASTTDSANVEVETRKKQSFYVGSGFGSDMLYSGYSLSKNQPYYSADMLYSYNSKWTLSAAVINLNGKTPAIAFYDFSAGYRHIFNNTFDAGASLSAYFTSEKLHEHYFGNFAYLSVSGGVDWYWVYTRAIYSTILDSKGGHYLQLKNSHYFATRDFMNKKAYVSFNPTVNFVFGDRYKLHTYTTGGNSGTLPGNMPVTQPQTETTYKSSFGLMDLEFSIPVALNYGAATLEVEPLYFRPIHKDPDFPSKSSFLLYANLYFRIF
ncbi:hypothetical protein [Alkaliflexus imshenetskii]|uniref:hypothetical protein n=1 Tax=Alkaliflexus imshenetskii TaxID=286730 RepID=UPI00047E8F64|nr:hypothetical protein [Alkaliflexus imshenetskii]